MVFDMLIPCFDPMQLGATLIRGETRTPAIDCDLLKNKRDLDGQGRIFSRE